MALLVKRYLLPLPRLTGFFPGLLSAWVLAMIALPILKYFWGQAGLLIGLTATVLLQVAVILAVVRRAWGLGPTIRLVALAAGLSWLIEFIGSSTGFPFGRYYYTGLVQPQLGGVPLLIPLAWLMMLPCAWAVAQVLNGGRFGPAFIAWSALAMTAWDLFLDPQMVAWGLWVWANPGGYFGVPWVNFGGWLLASALITAVIRPGPLPVPLLLLIYALTWLFETGGLLFFWGLPGPAVVGFASMGSLLWAVYLKRSNIQR